MTDKYQAILNYVKQENIRYVSFDVFDTLVFRHADVPASVFAQVILNLGEFAPRGLTAKEFCLLRQHAERAARVKELDREEVTLAQIYQQMPFDEITQASLIDAELQSEKAFSMVNLRMLEVIEELHELGVEVCLISDMYLNCQQVRETYFSNSSLLQSLPLHISAELGVTKFSGRAFAVVKSERNWSPEQWLHVGDNIDADVKSPQAAGLHALHFHPQLDTWLIRTAEANLFHVENISSAQRLLACMTGSPGKSPEATAYELGAFVWGPILSAFAQWIIDKADETDCSHIVCLMREAYLFAPLVEQKLAALGRSDIAVVALYISRKAAFWPAIDTNQPHWLEDVMDTLMTYRGYTLENFISDFGASPQLLADFDPKLELKNIEGLFVQGEPLYMRLCREAHDNREQLKSKIAQQRRLVSQYFSQTVGASYEQCAVVDFGNGGTIQHSMEKIFSKKAGANLLFYSSLRLFRFIDSTLYFSFISPANDHFRLSERLARSPECVEALLLGPEGSTLGYREGPNGIEPVTEEGSALNKNICKGFLDGVKAFITQATAIPHLPVSVSAAIGMLARYVLMPTQEEASLFTQLHHQDNFGTQGEYPVIDQAQKDWVERFSLADTLSETIRSNRWQLGHIHWPQGVISLLNKDFLPQSYGLIENSNAYFIQTLVNKLIAIKWKKLSIYGAGEFYRELAPFLAQNNIGVQHLIDRRAEVSGSYEVQGNAVITLEQALKQGANKFLISSYAFREEIAERIFNTAKERGFEDVEIISV